VTDVIFLDARRPDPAGIARAAALLRAGALVAFPTETVYGLGAHALDVEAVRRIFTAKGRPAGDPLIVHVHDDSQLRHLAADVPPAVAALASRFWPGPLTIVLPRAARVPTEVTAGLNTVAIRVPAHPIAHALIAAAAIPVAAPSANLFSRPSPTRAEHVLQDLDGRIDLVIDGGPTDVGVESTVLDLTEATPTILRPGAITLEMIRAVLPNARMQDDVAGRSDIGMKSPGQLAKHYSPRTPLTLYEGEPGAVVARIAADVALALAAGRRVGVLAANEDPLAASSADGLRVEKLGSERDLTAIAANLYHALRQLDADHVDLIVARSFGGDADLGVTISDRLRRAAAGRIVIVDN
jgi:L-threonylcarbamoyladenylate synthase